MDPDKFADIVASISATVVVGFLLLIPAVFVIKWLF